MRRGRGKLEPLPQKNQREFPVEDAGSRSREVEIFAASVYRGFSFSAAELMQYRRPVGSGPSLKTWPRWPLHFEHNTSVRIMPWLRSDSSSTWLSAAGCVKLGQ